MRIGAVVRRGTAVALAVSGNPVFVGGSFTKVGGASQQGFAVFPQ